MVPRARFELATHGFSVRRSTGLSYLGTWKSGAIVVEIVAVVKSVFGLNGVGLVRLTVTWVGGQA